MSDRTRQCPFAGCGELIYPERFACRPHWYRLTLPERAEIQAAYVGWKAGEVAADELRGRQQAVIDAVEARIARGAGADA